MNTCTNRSAAAIRTKRYLRPVLAGGAILSAAFLIAACGGGGGGGGSTGQTRGAITGFGSVFVNGVEFRTDPATHRKDLDIGTGDVSGTDNEVFRKGMVVTVRHGDDSLAEEIDYENDLEGPVAGFDNATKSFTILGQPVVYDNTTNIELDGGAALANGAIAEVSGLADGSGVIHATYVEVKPGPGSPPFEIKGYVSAIDNAAKTFRLGPVSGTAAVTVDYSSASLSDLPGGALANGLFVEVKTNATGLVAGKLPAVSVEGRTDIGHDDDRTS